jgi:ferrous iron transport protein B
MSDRLTIGIVGNPNCGKSTLFNALTGSNQHVGNWPGVTVEKKYGEYSYGNEFFQIVDLPGTYSLESSDDQVSLDEKVARDFIASGDADLIVNIVDASNIERNLYLTSQLLEMRVPMIVALNMMDIVKQRNIKIDVAHLSAQLQCPVIPLSAAKKTGLKDLQAAIADAAQQKLVPAVDLQYPLSLEQGIDALSAVLVERGRVISADRRWLALRLLEDDTLALQLAGRDILPSVSVIKERIEQECGEEIDILAADARYGFVHALTQAAVSRHSDLGRRATDKIDRVVLDRFLGIPIFLFVMYAMFMFTINIGSAFIDFFEQVSGAFLVDGLSEVLTGLGWPAWLIVFLANGVGGGIQVVATFIPIIGFLFLFLSALEDSGYMARAAFVMDRFMRMIGLPGKSFVPMIVGFGCNVPAIMATRTLENRRDRILTNLMNPFMSCGARLPVYALFAAAFFPVGGQNIVFGLYLIGIVVAVLTGLIMRHTLFKGGGSAFIMELPTYHWPTLRGVLLKTWERLRLFILNAGKVIVPMVLVLNFLNAMGTDGSFGHENSQQSVLAKIGKQITPLFRPMGIDDDNWPATVGIFTGILAKEAVVGTLDALYSKIGAEQTETETKPPFDLKEALIAASQTVPANLRKVAENILDPLGLNIGNIQDRETAAAEQEVKTATFGAMQKSFAGKTGAFAYLLFILLYMPCVTATAAIYRETGWHWAVFASLWTTGIAFMTSTIYFQVTVFSQHPLYSLSWIVGLLSCFLAVIIGLWFYGRRQLTGTGYEVLS